MADSIAENGVKRFAQHLLEVADVALKSEYLAEADAGLLRPARSDVEAYFQPMMELLNQYRQNGESSATEFGYECLWRLLGAAFLIGSYGIVSRSSENYFRPPIEYETRASQASFARKKRAERPEEKALWAAIQALHGTGPVSHPSKEALAILDSVNQQLKANGFESVKVDKIRRRLEKLPRS